jgi:hypothetical protein
MNAEVFWDITLFLTLNLEQNKITPTLLKPANMENVKQKTNY